MNDDLNGSVILCTGGSGSLGHALVDEIAKTLTPRKVIIYSRNEYAQHLMGQKYKDLPWLRFLIGDVRDKERLNWCLKEVDYVIHAAAMKRIEVCEYAPIEAIRTNIDGSVNVVQACMENEVKRAVLVSTDKAFEPRNLYGATKMAAEKLFLAANSYQNTQFRVIRYGNVLASHGSVVEIFQRLKAQGIKKFPITDPNCTRFFWPLSQAAQAVLAVLTAPANSPPVFIPKLPSMRITDLARAIDPSCEFDITGMREGEKLHESLMDGYTSDANDQWLTPEKIRKILGIDVDNPACVV